MKKVLMYNHGSSENHGCEAILRTVAGIIDTEYSDAEYTVTSFMPEADMKYIGECGGKFRFLHSDKLCALKNFEIRTKFIGAFSQVFHAIPFFGFLFANSVKASKEADLIISVGGDTYSYGKSAGLTTIDNRLRKHCSKSILWGCSINPEFLEGDSYKYKVDGLRRFSLITARESITYEALKALGLENVRLYPDPAFTLPTGEINEPMFDNDCDIVGINLSPLIRSYESGDNITFKCYVALIEHILGNTDFNVALISHVLSRTSNDSDCAREILKCFDESKRIKLFDKGSAVDIKGYISKCRYFVAARTHASIAAYSNCIPTLVVGYSVKAKGIAKDLFGTDKDYVIPVSSLSHESALIEAFKSLEARETEIKAHLTAVIPDFKARAFQVAGEVRALWGEDEK